MHYIEHGRSNDTRQHPLNVSGAGAAACLSSNQERKTHKQLPPKFGAKVESDYHFRFGCFRVALHHVRLTLDKQTGRGLEFRNWAGLMFGMCVFADASTMKNLAKAK